MAHDIGRLVEARGHQWQLAHSAVYDNCRVLTLEGFDAANRAERLRVIEPFERIRALTPPRLRRSSRRTALRAAAGAVARAQSAGGLWTAAAARIEVWPYQLEPALAAVGGATRLLLADAVGLGKTVQAGLLLCELFARGWAERALIACPAGLRHTWARELATRFDLDPHVVDQTVIADHLGDLPPGVNPWMQHAITIASIDLIKRPEVMAALESQPIDVLVADEAHHLTPGTDRAAAVSRLAARSPWCVLVSATPHSGDEAAFASLTEIGSHGEPLAVFRRSRADVGVANGRRTHLLAVTPTLEEAKLFSALDRYARAIWRERGSHDRAVRLIAMTLARRAASSAAAIAVTLARRRDLLAHRAPLPAQPSLPWDDADDADAIEPDALLGVPGFDDANAEITALDRLIDLSRRCSISSKIYRLKRLLDRAREPAVVFTEYRDTLDAVCGALRRRSRVGAIHGGVPADLRHSVLDAFNAGELDVLVATDAGGEGLNLHHRCRLVIDVELPWNPLRLEQRVGRVDRIGQTKTVHAVRLFHTHTVESRVRDHLQLRSRRASIAFDATPVSEMSVAGAIYGDEHVTDGSGISIRSVRIETAGAEALRIEQARRLRRVGAQAISGIPWTPARSRDRGSIVVLHRRSCLNRQGSLIATELRAHTLLLTYFGRREQQTAVDLAHRCIECSMAAATLPWRNSLLACSERIARRIEAIRTALRSVRIEEQASMFDRRADDAVAARRVALQRIDDGLNRVAEAAQIGIDGVRIELVAAWPERMR